MTRNKTNILGKIWILQCSYGIVASVVKMLSGHCTCRTYTGDYMDRIIMQ